MKWTLLSFEPLLLLDASYWLYMLMISLSQGATLLVLLSQGLFTLSYYYTRSRHFEAFLGHQILLLAKKVGS